MTDIPRLDHKIIYDLVESGSRVLDLGCGNGDLLFLLAKGKGARVQGIELSEDAIYRCVEKGLSVFHSDIDSGLSEYPDQSFDYVILNQSLQEARKADFVLQEALRVGKQVVVGFPNFAHIYARLQLGFAGRSPVTPSLPYRWYNSPNLHFLSIRDFRAYCREKGVRVLAARFLGTRRFVRFLPNLLALNAIFLISRRG
ncbi:MAG: methionine biosynthesis protein MetW [Deltaproteobacteria bacterium]